VLKSFDAQGWTAKGADSNRGPPPRSANCANWNHMLESWSRWLIEAPRTGRDTPNRAGGSAKWELLTDVLAPALDGQVQLGR